MRQSNTGQSTENQYSAAARAGVPLCTSTIQVMALALRATLPTACSEHELVAAVRRGDYRAFEELFSRYRRRISAYVFGMVGDYARAEDITQDVFISALRRMCDTERPITFKPWIYEIAKNACIDDFRRRGRAREVSFDEEVGPACAERDLASHQPTPDTAVENKQRLDDLRGAFGGLSESHHRILVLRELEGLSYNEIGKQMGISLAMVESTLFRARRRLSDEYQAHVSGQRCQRVRAAIDTSGPRSLGSLGLRERRQLARHLAHCQPCRRHARAAGLDESLFKAPSVAAKIAALLPLPWLRWRRVDAHEDALIRSGPHSLPIAQSLQSVARLADPLGPSIEFGRAAVVAATIAIAGAGGGLVSGLTSSGSASGAGANRAVAPAAGPGDHIFSFAHVFAVAAAKPSVASAGGALAPARLLTTGAVPGRGALARGVGAIAVAITPGRVKTTTGPAGAARGTAPSSVTADGRSGNGSSNHSGGGSGRSSGSPGGSGSGSGPSLSVPSTPSGSPGSSGSGVPQVPSAPANATSGADQASSTVDAAGTTQSVESAVPSDVGSTAAPSGSPAVTGAVSQVAAQAPSLGS